MKIVFLLVGSLALPPLLPAAAAQTAPAAPTKSGQPKTVTQQRTAARRAATYKGPKVVPDSKKLGREFINDSKPAPKLASPVKQ